MYSSSQRTPGGAQRKRKRDDTAPLRKRRKTASKVYKPRNWRSATTSYGFKKYNGEGPFPNKLATTLMYNSPAIVRAGSAGTGTDFIQVALNDLFDFDYSNVIGNKQPLFYDQLFSATGPYQGLECLGWRTVVTVLNLGAEAVSVYWNGRGSVNSLSEEDTLAEVTNRVGMKQFHLGPKGAGMDRCVFRTSGKWQDHNSDIFGSYRQAVGASPGERVYGTLFMSSPSSTTATNVLIQIDHYFDIIAERVDATVS